MEREGEEGGRVVPSGHSVNFSCRDSFFGYGDRNGGGGSALCFPGGAGATGGIMEAGFGDVRAKTRAAATLSAYVLNSAPGVIWLRRFSAARRGVAGCLMRLKGGGAGAGEEVGER